MPRRERGRPPHPDILTPAEWRVLEQVRVDHTNAEIAVRLGVSVTTVRYHLANIRAKLELSDRESLRAWRPARPRREDRQSRGWLALPVLTRAASVAAASVAGIAVVTLIAMATRDDSLGRNELEPYLAAVQAAWDQAMSVELTLPAGTTDDHDVRWAEIVEAHVIHEVDHLEALSAGLTAIDPPAALRDRHKGLVAAVADWRAATARYAEAWQANVEPDLRSGDHEGAEREQSAVDSRHGRPGALAQERAQEALCDLRDLAIERDLAFTAGCPADSS